MIYTVYCTLISNIDLQPEVGNCSAIILRVLVKALAPQLFLKGCADACAASILAFLSAIGQAQFKYCRLEMIAFQSNVIKVKKNRLRGT